MTIEENILLFKAELLKAEIAMQGMIAENKYKEDCGYSIAYDENSFIFVYKQIEEAIKKFKQESEEKA